MLHGLIVRRPRVRHLLHTACACRSSRGGRNEKTHRVRVACWWQLRTALAPIPWRAGILSACTFTKRLRTAYRLSNQRPCGGKAKALNLPAIRMRLSNFGGSYPPERTINAFLWLVKRFPSQPFPRLVHAPAHQFRIVRVCEPDGARAGNICGRLYGPASGWLHSSGHASASHKP